MARLFIWRVEFSPHSRYALKPFGQSFMFAKMRPHQTFPELAVIRHGEMKQFVNDDVIAQVAIQRE